MLERDGGVYRFRHILLHDYFANLSNADTAALAKAKSYSEAQSV
ncbi:MAG: hypothetical protein SH847_14075 [Roseiflexaceae bacterium]|nr:hypothetical protein [Roseiflexaceae bacterium]